MELRDFHHKSYPYSYEKLMEENGTPEPRRMVGNYLTYLVRNGNKSHTVIIKKFQEKYSATCDCFLFEKNHTCEHIGFVLDGIDGIIEFELGQKALMKRIIEENKLAFESQSAHNKIIIDDLQNKIKYISIAAELDRKSGLPISSSPFVIQNARDFGFYKLLDNIPSLKNSRYKKYKYLEMPLEKGYEVTISGHKVNEKVRLSVNTDDDIEVTCSCGDTYKNHPCMHSKDVIAHMAHNKGYTIFATFVNHDDKKNQLLEPYGLTLSDEEAAEFEFKLDAYGKIRLSNVPAGYLNIQKLHDMAQKIIPESVSGNRFIIPETPDFSLVPVFQLSHREDTNCPIKLDLAKVQTTKRGLEKLSSFSIDKEDHANIIRNWPDVRIQSLLPFSFSNYREGLGYTYYTQSWSIFKNQYYAPVRTHYLEYFFDQLSSSWHHLAAIGSCRLKISDTSGLISEPVSVILHEDRVHPDIEIEVTEKTILIRAVFTDTEGQAIIEHEDNIEIFQGRIIYDGLKLYYIKDTKYSTLLSLMPKGLLKTSIRNIPLLAQEILLPLEEQLGLEIPQKIKDRIEKIPLTPVLYFNESHGKYLSLQPRCRYGTIELLQSDTQEQFFETENGEKILIRDRSYEKEFVEFIRSLHPSFKSQTMKDDFVLTIDEAIKNMWFVHITHKLQDQNITMMGINDLNHIKINPAKPKWEMNVSSGIDWFDLKINIKWGDQTLPLREVRRAIMNKQNFIVLGDGSFGMLPEEWLTHYQNMFKFGVESDEGLKISKKHFNIIELLIDQIDDKEIQREIAEKKARLLNIENVSTQPIPDSIRATLRPYQENGYKWMQVLDEVSWGGCLADDMGLGKTLQTITFLAYIKEKYHHPTSLIVCPTSLLYNWENEIRKFAPDLSYHIYYGQGRELPVGEFNTFDLIITSYGIVRNDIERLTEMSWEYVILDESQAIKNPDAMTTKAMQLLKSRNRFILSGTPLQNNTFDIFAQFNFINPGLLGNKDIFRREFAGPIDKGENPDAGLWLRQMIKPFMLRRTKSEVAPDLPEKTETILWCQMDKSQQAMYDEYKNHYRNALMERIEKDGMGKSGMYILEGLLRLRQICDDPRLTPQTESTVRKGVKIKELLREINENMGNHKMLVFSQFTEMLALIRSELDEQNISYGYLDGSTSARERQEQVDVFQNENTHHVFLISLKAGGVGLNLTAAEYVYLVDPWWNPAVEQQAIDRTHRIGQKNNIFAYKMICKGTVEEKIIQLQEKKLSLSRELIHDDNAFFKNLTADDIRFLFS